MINPFTTPLKAFFGVVGGVAALAAIFFAYRQYDAWQAGRRQKLLDSANKHIVAADTLVAQADTQQAQILPTKRVFDVFVNSKPVRSNPVARTVANTAQKIIKADAITIAKQKAAIAHLDSANKDLQDAGPPLGPRAVPYGVIGYGGSNRQRATPVVKLGLDYRLLPHVLANAEISYQPPPVKAVDQRAEFRYMIGGRINFR